MRSCTWHTAIRLAALLLLASPQPVVQLPPLRADQLDSQGSGQQEISQRCQGRVRPKAPCDCPHWLTRWAARRAPDIRPPGRAGQGPGQECTGCALQENAGATGEALCARGAQPACHHPRPQAAPGRVGDILTSVSQRCVLCVRRQTCCKTRMSLAVRLVQPVCSDV